MRPTTIVVGVCLLAAGTKPAARADIPSAPGFYAVSYVEAVPSARGEAVAALKRYRDGCRKGEGFIRLEVFEQVGRSGHYAVVESWREQATFDARDAALQRQLLDTLRPIRVSDYDQRPYKPLAVAPPAVVRNAVSVVTHVDVAPNPRVAVLLTELTDASRKDAGNLRFDVYQHTMRSNHFTIVETWRTDAAREQHAAAAHTRQYREELQPMTGSPLDERVYRAVE
jgi:quinol monooxygenase YgiN